MSWNINDKPISIKTFGTNIIELTLSNNQYILLNLTINSLTKSFTNPSNKKTFNNENFYMQQDAYISEDLTKIYQKQAILNTDLFKYTYALATPHKIINIHNQDFTLNLIDCQDYKSLTLDAKKILMVTDKLNIITFYDSREETKEYIIKQYHDIDFLETTVAHLKTLYSLSDSTKKIANYTKLKILNLDKKLLMVTIKGRTLFYDTTLTLQPTYKKENFQQTNFIEKTVAHVKTLFTINGVSSTINYTAELEEVTIDDEKLLMVMIDNKTTFYNINLMQQQKYQIKTLDIKTKYIEKTNSPNDKTLFTIDGKTSTEHYKTIEIKNIKNKNYLKTIDIYGFKTLYRLNLNNKSENYIGEIEEVIIDDEKLLMIMVDNETTFYNINLIPKREYTLIKYHNTDYILKSNRNQTFNLYLLSNPDKKITNFTDIEPKTPEIQLLIVTDSQDNMQVYNYDLSNNKTYKIIKLQNTNYILQTNKDWTFNLYLLSDPDNMILSYKKLKEITIDGDKFFQTLYDQEPEFYDIDLNLKLEYKVTNFYNTNYILKNNYNWTFNLYLSNDPTKKITNYTDIWPIIIDHKPLIMVIIDNKKIIYNTDLTKSLYSEH